MSTSAPRPPVRLTLDAVLARVVAALSLSSSLALATAACGGTVVFDESADGSGSGGSSATGVSIAAGTASGAATTSTNAGGGAEPLTCDLVEGPVELLPAKTNPPGCRAAMTCDVWFGHGQHMTCPSFTSEEAPFATCDVWDCLCEIYEVDGFVANFATGEVVDARDPNVTCRYMLVPAG